MVRCTGGGCFIVGRRTQSIFRTLLPIPVYCLAERFFLVRSTMLRRVGQGLILSCFPVIPQLEGSNAVALEKPSHDFGGFREWVAGVWVASGVVVIGSPANMAFFDDDKEESWCFHGGCGLIRWDGMALCKGKSHTKHFPVPLVPLMWGKFKKSAPHTLKFFLNTIQGCFI
jgi:hypothetical protein